MTTFYRFNIIVILIGLMFGCVKKVPITFPQDYVTRSDSSGIAVAIPPDAKLVDALDVLKCGEYICEVADLGRIYYVHVRSQDVLLQESGKKSDLAIVMECGQRYLCMIDTNKITIVKHK